MTTLEDALREALAHQVAKAPTVIDAAGTAIVRARIVRRRRHAAAGTAAILAVALVASSAWWLRDTWPGAGTDRSSTVNPVALPPVAEPMASTPAPDTLPFDLFDAAGTILTSDGRGIRLSDAASRGRVQRVPAGWLYASQSADTRLVPVGVPTVTTSAMDGLVSTATGVDIGVDGDRFVTSTDGLRIAWLSEPEPRKAAIKLATLTAAAVTGVVATPVPADTTPVAIVGSTVVLSSVDGYDTWDATRSAFKATWSKDVTGVIGRLGDQLIGTVSAGPGGGSDCLAPLTVAVGLRVSQRRCDGLRWRPWASNAVSPDGRWIAGTSAGSSILILSVALLFTKQQAQGCSVSSDVQQAAWQDSRHLVVRTTIGWARCGVDGTVEPIADSHLDDWSLIPRSG